MVLRELPGPSTLFGMFVLGVAAGDIAGGE
jgi:hypothetical protein